MLVDCKKEERGKRKEERGIGECGFTHGGLIYSRWPLSRAITFTLSQIVYCMAWLTHGIMQNRMKEAISTYSMHGLMVGLELQFYLIAILMIIR